MGEAKEQLQRVWPMVLGLITNILSNPTHSNENVIHSYSHLHLSMFLMCLFHLTLCKKKNQRKLIYCNVMCLIQARLLRFVQSISLLICNLSLKRLPLQTKHNPMCPIPNLNIMVEPTLEVTTRVEAINKGERRLQEKMQAFNHAINNIALYMLKKCIVIVVSDLGDYVLQVYIVFMVIWV